MKKESIKENVTEQELIEILKTGNIKMKRLTVGVHSRLDGIELKWTSLPKDILIGPIVRKNEVILPDGDTKLKNGDVIIIFGSEKDLDIIKELLLAEGLMARIKRIIAGLVQRKKTAIVPSDESDYT
ncbi:MAG TPA: TrkA C-terminal domain-containing protein [Spirochaetota bacterium]|nr:TrkA C-terminal domain-containing protein [Spirochaetota bacterium]HPJ35430.1 TrkA C-terminal domain-containing protein [Spirochaetota bacterium]